MEVFSKVNKVKLPEMKVVSSHRVSENPEEEVIEFLCSWMQSKGFDLEKQRGFGFDIPVSDEELSAGKRGYEYLITVDKEVECDPGIEFKTIAADNYALMRISEPFEAPFERIGNGWRILVGEASKLKNEDNSCDCDGRYCLEEVIIEGDATYMDLYLPI
ncbi:MAG: effector binding domain-containing protein [Candidatus Stygibacter australis]|nr:effector binding domain-containing protein [Candidatus Stygibacter australis]MDP8322723.1 effector binding domain-containing protein [Candidatus Stygibacter australis]